MRTFFKHCGKTCYPENLANLGIENTFRNGSSEHAPGYYSKVTFSGISFSRRALENKWTYRYPTIHVDRVRHHCSFFGTLSTTTWIEDGRYPQQYKLKLYKTAETLAEEQVARNYSPNCIAKYISHVPRDLPKQRHRLVAPWNKMLQILKIFFTDMSLHLTQ